MQKRSLKEYFSLLLKGAGMGAANVIPGVSGGTIALITGIFEELIDSIKSFDLKAIKLLFTGKLKEFSRHVNLWFLVAVFLGVAISILSLAKLLEYLFANYPVYVWAFFFGLILASVYFIGRTIHRWNAPVIVSLLIGTGVAVVISVLNPASENDHFLYLLICGVVAVCSMILPGLSGSFVLILLGNYELVMINAVSHFKLDILIPVVLGAAAGLILFSHFLSWVFKKYRNETISLLTGFILGSLAVLWPWKDPIYKLDAAGQVLTKSDGKMVIASYERFLPETINSEVLLAIVFAVIGIIVIWVVEKFAGTIQEEEI
jgi:putative membrane protein